MSPFAKVAVKESPPTETNGLLLILTSDCPSPLSVEFNVNVGALKGALRITVMCSSFKLSSTLSPSKL